MESFPQTTKHTRSVLVTLFGCLLNGILPINGINVSGQ